jgi:serine phosphatase RsbU (regulator of sigma subunit)
MLSDVVLEVARAVVMTVIFAFMVVVGHRQSLYEQRGYLFIVSGFGLLLFGAVLDITDNYEELNQYVVVGDTQVEAFFEKVVGYLLGFVLLFIGFWYWLPLVGEIRRAEQRLQNYSKDLEVEVAKRTEDLQLTNEQLQESQDRIAAASRQIMESIHYASRIQSAVLPSPRTLAMVTADHFLIWQPRDVVGGDFYWFRQVDGGYLTVLGDCTGHGVPGAFMTLIVGGLLEQVVANAPPDDPAKMLSQLHRELQVSLGQHKGEALTDDGLEAGACFVNGSERRLVFAGAHFSLWCGVDGEAKEIRGDRPGLGFSRFGPDTVFTNVPIELKRGQAFYMTTDGLIDQIGGERRRPFGKRRLAQFVAEHHRRPMSDQASVLGQMFQAHQGDEARRDDVAVLGFAPLGLA